MELPSHRLGVRWSKDMTALYVLSFLYGFASKFILLLLKVNIKIIYSFYTVHMLCTLKALFLQNNKTNANPWFSDYCSSIVFNARKVSDRLMHSVKPNYGDCFETLLRRRSHVSPYFRQQQFILNWASYVTVIVFQCSWDDARLICVNIKNYFSIIVPEIEWLKCL